MFYITGDMHGDFKRLSKKKRPQLTKDDFVIVCGDFGLLWADDKELLYNLRWLSSLPFQILWVQGNHENYNLIANYPLSKWNGGMVRKITNNIMLLERGQVFEINGTTFFTFGGASSHDMENRILDRAESDFKKKRAIYNHQHKAYRILNESWWPQELPEAAELETGRKNLEVVHYKVDYVITHCCSSTLQRSIGEIINEEYKEDCLTQYFDELETKLEYKKWFFGHYHANLKLDEKHQCLYEDWYVM